MNPSLRSAGVSPASAGAGGRGRRRSITALLLLAVALITNAAAQPSPPPVSDTAILAVRPPETLSAYHLFRDAGARTPNDRVTPYDLNTPLWSDGALKFRYVYVPQGAQAQYREDGVFEFPVGTVLIKTFAFSADMRHPDRNVRFLETRLLIRRADGWVAYPYVWNAEQTEARLSPIGATLPVDFITEVGANQHLDWEVPNRNQCKGCHDLAGDLTPIGPTARNLNRGDQLARWREAGIAGEMPADIPHFAAAYDSASGTVAERARAYLQVNCAHCHNPQGPAHTSGLDLRWNAQAPIQWGVFKRPVAAGRGSAGYDFAIEPGHPERSILISRMESVDPGVMMPELGRTLVDQRAVALMREWVAAMDREGRTGE